MEENGSAYVTSYPSFRSDSEICPADCLRDVYLSVMDFRRRSQSLGVGVRGRVFVRALETGSVERAKVEENDIILRWLDDWVDRFTRGLRPWMFQCRRW